VKVAVISDVHANLPALEAVLADIAADGADELWCLGDLTGYGGSPGPCLEIVLDRADISLSGNHDMVITGEIKLDAFSHDARAAAEWTMGVLDPEQLRRLSELRPSGERHDVELNHGSIRDPVWEYVIDDRTAAICIEHQTSALGMVGHSHVPLAYGYADGAFLGGLAAEGCLDYIVAGPLHDANVWRPLVLSAGGSSHLRGALFRHLPDDLVLTPDPDAEQEMLKLLNDERTSRGLPALELDPRLVPIARQHSEEMFKLKYFGHQSPANGSPFDRLAAAEISYSRPSGARKWV